MEIRFKGVKQERMEDAPFIGAAISAIGCEHNCLNCFNQHLKEYPTLIMESQDLIDNIITNPINEGIILSGLEWTLQLNEMIDLLHTAKLHRLKTMLYTGSDIDDFMDTWKYVCRFTSAHPLHDLLDYIKFGKYDEAQLSDTHYCHGVKLASKNQIILSVDELYEIRRMKYE